MREHLTCLFPLFTDIRMKVKPNNAIMWFLSILLLVQSMLTVFFSSQPTLMVDFSENQNPGIHTLLVFLFVSWFDSATFSLFDSGILLLVQIILFILIYVALRKKRFGFYTSVIHLKLIYYSILIITYGISVPLYFRVSLSLDYLILNPGAVGIFSLILVLITFFFHFIIIYIQSVFLDQFDFIPESTFSLYEGKSSPLFRLIHFLSILSCYITPIIPNIDVRQGVAFLTLAIAVIGFYFRVLPCPHFSILGQFLDTSFLWFTAPILIIKSFLGKFKNYLIAIFFGLEIIYFLVLYMIRKQISKRSIEIFNIFANCHVSSSTFSSSGISPHNYVTVIRSYALTIADPNVFEQFRQMQQLFDKRASIQIEIIRFLGLFPSKRSQMLEEIQNTTSKNLYNRFMLHLFSEKLTALTMNSTEADRSAAFDLYTAYTTKMCKYWKCRYRKQKMKSFTNGMVAITLRMELKHEIKVLLEKYPFDPKVRKMYVNFLIIASGDTEEIKNQQSILHELEGNSPSITDPMLHNVSSFNPRILRYLTKSERETCSCITTIRVKSPPTFAINSGNENENKNEIVRSLEKPPRSCLITTVIPHIYMAILLIVFTSLLIEYEYKSSVISERTFEVNNLTIDRFYIGSATFFLPFTNIRQLIQNEVNLDSDFQFLPSQMTDSQCCNYFIDLEEKEREYFSNNPSLVDFSAYCVSSSIELYLKNEEKTLCDLAQSLNEDPSYETKYQFKTMISALSNTSNQIQLELRNFTKRDRFVWLLILFFVGFIITSFIEFIGFYVYLNSQMSEFYHFFAFLGSDERKDLIEEGRAEDSWEILKDRNSRSPTFSEVSVRIRNISYVMKPNFFFDLSSWVCLLILLFDIAVPHLIRVESQSKNHKKFDDTYTMVQYVIYLMMNITSSILGDPLDVNLCRLLAHNLTVSGHPISYQYANYSIPGIGPIQKMASHVTVSYLVERYLNGSLSNSDIEDIFVPSLFDFARYSVIEVFVKEANTREIFHKEAVISFSLAIFIIIIIFLISGVMHFKEINSSISKLFIFPKSYFEADIVNKQNHSSNDDDNELNLKKNLEQIPDNLLVITIITDTKKIYSVSDNSINIISKQSSLLINTNFFDLFSPTPDNDPNFLILKSSDKKKCKVFKVKIIEKGQITHYLLLDDSSKVLSSLPNVTPALQLSNFMTPFFAEQFASENVRSVLLNDSFFIFIKIKVIGVDINTIESVYASFFAQLTKSFSNVKCIKVDGSLIELAISNTPSVLTALFLMRDIFNNPKSSVGIHSVFIDHIEEARFTLNTTDEPCVICENKEIENDETILYKIDFNNIALNVSLASQLPDELKSVKFRNVPVDFACQNFTSVISYSFNEFLDLMARSYI